jgi:L-lysine 6-transaminase
MGNGVIYMLHPMGGEGVLDSTWGGSLGDMVRFVQEWRIVQDEGLIEQVPEKTEHLVRALHSLQRDFPQQVKNIRGAGLYQGFSLPTPAQKADLIERALQNEDLLLLGAGRRSIRFRPHLNVTNADTDLLIEKLRRVLSGSGARSPSL